MVNWLKSDVQKKKKKFIYIDGKIVEVRRAKKIKLKKKVGWKGNQNHPKKGNTHPIYPIKERKDIDNIKVLLKDQPRNFALFITVMSLPSKRGLMQIKSI